MVKDTRILVQLAGKDILILVRLKLNTNNHWFKKQYYSCVRTHNVDLRQ